MQAAEKSHSNAAAVPEFRGLFFRRLPNWAGGLTAAIGGLALAGWIFDVGELKSVLPELAVMKVNTALGFIALGFGLILAQAGPDGALRARIARGLALGAALIGALTLVEYLGRVDLRIDQLFFADAATPDKFFPGRMAPATAIFFVFLGAALALDVRRPAARLLALLAGAGGLLALLGYLFGISSLYAVGAFSSMALHTTIAFLLCSLGVLFTRPETGFMALFTGSTPAGMLARRLLPAAIVTPAVLGWLLLRGELAGYYDTRFGASLFATSLILIFSALIVWTTGALAHREAALAAGEARFRRTLDSMMEGCQIIGFDWRYLYVNGAVAEHGGRAREELLGRTMMDIYPGIEDTPVFGVLRGCMEGRRPAHLDNEFNPGDGVLRWFELSIQPVPEGLFVLSIDITARRRAEAAVRELNASLEKRVSDRTAELDAANRELESFSYSVSHDLRAPLRHVQGYVDMLGRTLEGRLDTKAAHYLQTITAASVEMGQLIDDLLAFSRMGRVEMQGNTLDLDVMVQEARRKLEPAAAERHITWKIAPLPRVQGDPAMLRQVLANLLNNALKYSRTRNPAEIEIGCAGEESGRVILFVRDNGVGFDNQYGHKLFGVFQRLHRADEFEGTGIGLATVRRIIARHGGRTWGEGQVDAGACFYLTLSPAPNPALNPATPPQLDAPHKEPA